jgi:hypothetical protein
LAVWFKKARISHRIAKAEISVRNSLVIEIETRRARGINGGDLLEKPLE